ncbi:MAG: hypothetical protein PVG35_17840, partial [Desulfobacterales bacterium]
MVSNKFASKWKSTAMLMVMWIVALSPLMGIAAEDKKKPPPEPVTTGNFDISIEELNYRLKPMTKDDLAVEADGWLQVIKKHGEKLSDLQISALTAKDDEKTQLLESVNQLKEQQTRLTDRFKAVIEEFRSKGGKVDDYEAYSQAISGVDVEITDAKATWTTITGWLTSTEGGLRWVKNISLFLVVVLA